MHEVILVMPPRFVREMKKAVLEGRKTCTTRSEPKGKVGDRWPLENKIFEYTAIEQHSLNYVAEHLYREEGFNTPDEFRNAWCRYHRMRPEGHPKEHPYWKQSKWTHWFKLVEKLVEND